MRIYLFSSAPLEVLDEAGMVEGPPAFAARVAAYLERPFAVYDLMQYTM